MNWLDIVIIVLLVIQVFIGLKQGLIRAILSLGGLIVGILLAGRFYQPVSNIFSFVDNEKVADVLAFILILVLVLLAAFIIALLLRSFISRLMLGLLDSIGGAVFGLVSGFIFLGAIMAIWVKFFGSDLVADSFLGRLMLDYFPLVLGLLPGEFGDDIRNFFQP